MPEGQANRDGNGLTPIDALHAACARNAPLEIVQADLVGEEPFARGRMIEIESGVLMVDTEPKYETDTARALADSRKPRDDYFLL